MGDGRICRSGGMLSAVLLGLVSSGTLGYAASCVVAPTSSAPPLDPTLRQTVVVTDPAILNDPGVDFSLGRTLGNIIKTTPGMVDSQAERVALLTSLVRSFRVPSHINPDSQAALPMTVRQAEASLDPIALLDKANANGMKVVGLFNRYDLAPADFKTCGEHRIVYAKNSSGPLDRFLIIFEAALDNPQPQLGAEGCRAIAQFWDGLKTKTGTELATALSQFYYDGLAPGVEPVVHFTNYGLPFGQVRGNLFVQLPWQLREWRIGQSADGSPVFTPVTVKTNPFPPFYGMNEAGEDAKIKALRTQFKAAFAGTRVPELVTVDQGGIVGAPEAPIDLFFQLGAAFPNRFNTFESQSQGTKDDPNIIATPDLKTNVTQRLNQIGVGSACELTAEHVLNRAGALSCGGCHQFTVGKPVANGVNWPNSKGFVHIDETGQVSDALEQFFLPARQQNLARHAQSPASPVPPPPPPAAGPDASASATSPVQALRAKAKSIPASENRLNAITSLTEVEREVQSLRAEDQATPGAFVPYRRTH